MYSPWRNSRCSPTDSGSQFRAATTTRERNTDYAGKSPLDEALAYIAKYWDGL
ncbi:hypothetical protein ACVIOG_003902 [Rhizobium leguminosarum]